ncbi:MAG: hypothetical protein Q9165_002695 [Trypethelium subeluteriae]
MKLFTTFTALGLAAGAMAQSTNANPQQVGDVAIHLNAFHCLQCSLGVSPVIGLFEVATTSSDDFAQILNSYVPTTIPSSEGPGASTFAFWTPPFDVDGTGIPSSFLTATPSISSLPWFTYVPSQVLSSIASFQLSDMSAERALVTSALNFTGVPSATTTKSQTSNGTVTEKSPTSTSSAAPSTQTHGSGAMRSPIGWTMGLAAGAVGVAAVLL